MKSWVMSIPLKTRAKMLKMIGKKKFGIALGDFVRIVGDDYGNYQNQKGFITSVYTASVAAVLLQEGGEIVVCAKDVEVISECGTE